MFGQFYSEPHMLIGPGHLARRA